jgi:hypothetical protein
MVSIRFPPEGSLTSDLGNSKVPTLPESLEGNGTDLSIWDLRSQADRYISVNALDRRAVAHNLVRLSSQIAEYGCHPGPMLTRIDILMRPPGML